MQRIQKMQMVLRIVFVIAMVAVLIPQPVQAEGGGGGITGVIVEHVSTRMADAIVDLVCVRHADGEVWAVAGFLVPRREGLVYVSNGPWKSSGEIESYVHAEVYVQPYVHSGPYLLRIESLFEYTHILFWKIDVVYDRFNNYTERHRESAELRREKTKKAFLRASQ